MTTNMVMKMREKAKITGTVGTSGKERPLKRKIKAKRKGKKAALSLVKVMTSIKGAKGDMPLDSAKVMAGLFKSKVMAQFPALIDAYIRMASGQATKQRVNRKGVVTTYTLPSDPQIIMDLFNRMLGKPVERFTIEEKKIFRDI